MKMKKLRKGKMKGETETNPETVGKADRMAPEAMMTMMPTRMVMMAMLMTMAMIVMTIIMIRRVMKGIRIVKKVMIMPTRIRTGAEMRPNPIRRKRRA